MKLNLIMTLCCVWSLHAGTLYSQDNRYDVSFNNITVEKAINQLRQQTGYMFLYMEDVIERNQMVTLSLSHATLEEILRGLLPDRDFQFHINDGLVVISLKERVDTQQQKRSPAVIKGVVRGQDGNPIVGASVYVKGNSRIGTTTDVQGNYLLDLQNLAAPVVAVSFIGMEPYEFVPTQETNDVMLKEGANQINPVNVTVNTGYQDIPRDRMTGAYTSMTRADFKNNVFESLAQALQGKVAGLYSTTPSGEPGVQSQIRIRGDNSISGSKEPLWVVDGLPLQQGVATISGLTSGDLQQSILNHGVGNIAPWDIESVTILKDAAATAIYGASAAAGVIVVKTRKGSSGPVSVSYQGSFSLGEAPRQRLDFMNAAEKVDYEIELAEQFGVPSSLGRAAWVWDAWQHGDISTAEYNNTLAQMRAVDVDWFDEIYRTSFSQKHNLSLRGGTDKMWFYSSISATDEKAILKSNRYNAFSASVNVGYRPARKLTMDFKLEGSYRETNNHNSAVDPFKYAVFANPYERPYNDDGSYAWDRSYGVTGWSQLHNGTQFERFNILNEMEKTGSKNMAVDLTATMSLSWQITEHLKAEAYARMGYSTSMTEAFADKGTYSSWSDYLLKRAFQGSNQDTRKTEIPDEFNSGYIQGSTGRSPSYSMRAGFAYDRDINSQHFFNLYVGGELRSSESWANSYRTANYDNQYFFTGFPELKWNPQLDKNLWGPLNSMSKYVYGNKDRYVSFFGAFTYSYQDRYVVNANARFDGASTIYAKNRFTPLWSVSARWNIHKESFVRDHLPFLSEFALRGVFGYTGQIDKTALPFPYIRLGTTLYDAEYAALNVYFPNPGIKWEKKLERSIGLDYSLFNNVFGGSINYYNNKTLDLLTNSTVANSFGNVKPRINKGSLTNRGFEFHFNLRLELGQVRWLTSFNIARNTNKITDTFYKDPAEYEDDQLYNIWAGYSGNVEGYPTGTTFGYRVAGVDPQSGDVMVYLSEETRRRLADDQDVDISQIGYTASAEAISHSILAHSLTNIGNVNPKYYGGFGTTLQWKGFELRANFSYATNRVLESFNEQKHTFQGIIAADGGIPSYSDLRASRLNRLRSAKNRWRTPGDVTEVPRYSVKGSDYYFMYTDDKYEKAGYLKFNDISLTYNIKAPFMKAIGMSDLRVGFQVSNVAIWSKYSGLDASTSNPFAYPQQRRYMLNIQLSF